MSTTSPPAISPRCERGRIGERYILGGENVLLGDMLADIATPGRAAAADASGCRGAALPDRLRSAKLLARLTGKEPFVTVRRPADGAPPHVLHDRPRRERELGYVARPYREGLADAIAWFRAHGYLE